MVGRQVLGTVAFVLPLLLEELLWLEMEVLEVEPLVLEPGSLWRELNLLVVVADLQELPLVLVLLEQVLHFPPSLLGLLAQALPREQLMVLLLELVLFQELPLVLGQVQPLELVLLLVQVPQVLVQAPLRLEVGPR
jgi:hypothetical protein